MASTKKKSDDHKRTSHATDHHHKDPYPNQTCDLHSFRKEHRLLSELLSDDGIIFECNAQAPSPSKDYGQLEITMDKVILRWWKISLRNLEDAKYPGEIKDSYEDFYHDEAAHREIWRIFGHNGTGARTIRAYLPVNCPKRVSSAGSHPCVRARIRPFMIG